MKLEIFNTSLDLMPEKALFLPDEKVLIIADLHFGKVNHFRRSGLPVPLGAGKKNAETLVDLINHRKPERTIFLGDLFHSHYNDDWEVVGQIMKHFSACKFQLVRGNHDIMSQRQYERYQIEVLDHLALGSLWLTHEPMEIDAIPDGMMNVAGHLHPGAHLSGKGRQAITLSCFWHSKNQMILPAFGSFTGLAIVRPAEGDRIFLIIEDKIVEANMAVRERKQGFSL